MYEELIKELRYCADEETTCSKCKRVGQVSCEVSLHTEAADAIEKLQARVKENDDWWAMAKTLVDMVAPKWIPVTERLPEQGKQVLVTGIEAIGNVRIYSVKQLDGDVWRPTSAPSCYWEHWMPLPSTEGLNET